MISASVHALFRAFNMISSKIQLESKSTMMIDDMSFGYKNVNMVYCNQIFSFLVRLKLGLPAYFSED